MPSPDRTQVAVDGRTLEVSNLAKVLYPRAGFTKGQMIDYYARVAPVLLPHLADRPLTLVRYPNGVDAAHFYEKRCPPHAPDWVRTAAVPSGRAGVVNHVVCSDLATLVWLANLAALELHPLLAKAERLDHPTSLVFDLDPGAPADILTAARVALLVRELLDAAGHQALVKTSGSKGLHVIVPLEGTSTYDDTRPYSQAVAQTLAQRHRDLVVAVQRKELRAGRVLVDWNQNGFTNTTACVYSLRATPTPRVSTPVTWDEIDDALTTADPDRLSFGPDEVLARIATHGDLLALAAR